MPAIKPHTIKRKLGLPVVSKSCLEMGAGWSHCTSHLFPVWLGSDTDASAGGWVKGSCYSLGAVALE